MGDGTPPTLGGASAPAGGSVGAPLSFGVTPADDLGLAGVQWAFGDGTSAAGPSATHAFGTTGSSSWSVTATDLAGNTAGATGELSIAAPLAVRIAKPRRGTRARRLRRLRGTASGPVALVQLALVRTSGGCRRLRASGRLTAARPAGRSGCRRGRFLKARGTRNWNFRLRRRLPAGRYTVWARARSASGATSRVARVTFKLRP
jgi:PKD domain